MYRAELLERLSPEIFETVAYDWLINMAITQYGNAGLLPQVATMYRIHQRGQWSQIRQQERDKQIRSLLPRYIEVVGDTVGRELTHYMHALDTRVAQSVDMTEATADITDENSVRLPVPRVSSKSRPRVSVVMPCYNHEQFVVAAINSVLDQTMADFELIVVDDGSVDGSMGTIASMADPRMRVYRLSQNQGGAAALNFAIQQARSEYVAVINSDDMWERHKLERQLEVFEHDPACYAVFTGARFIDESGHPLPPERIPRWNDIFRQPNRTRAQWLRFFFEEGNALCHPSVLIRREFYVEHGLYDNRLRQLPDFQRWITLIKHHPIVVLGSEDLVRFRLLAAERNPVQRTRPTSCAGCTNTYRSARRSSKAARTNCSSRPSSICFAIPTSPSVMSANASWPSYGGTPSAPCRWLTGCTPSGCSGRCWGARIPPECSQRAMTSMTWHCMTSPGRKVR